MDEPSKPSAEGSGQHVAVELAEADMTAPLLITHVRRGDDDLVPVVLDARVDGRVWVRAVLEGDPEPKPIPFDPGKETLSPFTPVTAVALHLSAEVGRIDDLVVWAPVVEVRRDDSTIFVRTVESGEEPPTEPVRWSWDRALSFEPGALVVDLELIDAQSVPNDDGYVPVAGVLSAWLSVGPNPALEAGYRYLLAAARRLDACQRQFVEVTSLLELLTPGIPGPILRARFFAMVGTVETAVVALGRAVDMAVRLNRLVGVGTPVPSGVSAVARKLSVIRNAYEHIEDRALGQVQGAPHPDALTIFDYGALVEDHAVTYGQERLDLGVEVPALIESLRQFLKAAAIAIGSVASS